MTTIDMSDMSVRLEAVSRERSCVSHVFRCLFGALALLLFAAGPAAAQDHDVSGTVTSVEDGLPLPGVNVIVRGTTIGTATGPDGTYSLTVPSAQDTLQFTFVGYEPQEVPIAGRATIDVELAPSALEAEELVVVGYSTQRKQDLTGSVDVVDVDDLTSIPTGDVTSQLQGQASGINVISSGQPGESPQIYIRGFNTFGNNTPLYVVDGVPTQNISTLNSNDIESLQVLKDAGAASIYGSRASNGVVIITTKKGAGDVRVSYDAYYGYQMPERDNVWDILSPQEMAELRWMARSNDPGFEGTYSDALYGDDADQPVLPEYIAPTGASSVDLENYNVDPNYTNPDALGNFFRIVEANHAGTDWYREIVQPAPMTKNDITVSGGGDIGNYLFSLGYFNQQGTVMETYLERYTVRANTQFNVGDRIRIGENLAYTLTENPQVAALTEGSAIAMSFRQQPIIPVYDVMGNFAGAFGTDLGNAYNPVAMQYRNRNNGGQGQRLFGNVFAEVDLLEPLMLRSSFGGEVFSGYWHSFNYPTYENTENGTTNQYNEAANSGRNWTWTNTLTYRDVLAENHNLTLVAGTEMYHNTGREVGGSTQGYFSFDPSYTNLNTGAGTKTNYSFTYADALLSLIGRLDYNYADRYLLSFTLRRDGSSKFLRNRYGWFPAVTAGWRVTEEPFFGDVSWLTDLKIRGGYGVMGNQLNVSSDNPYTLYVGTPTDSYYDITGSNGNKRLGFRQGTIGNPNARWERDANINVGFDASLFNGRLEATVDYYQKRIDDLLYNPELPGTAGDADVPFANVASMRNDGVDLSLRGRGTLGDEFNYNATVTFTTYRNEITEVAEGFDYFSEESRRFNGTDIVRNEAGHPMSSFYGYNIIGFWDDEEEIIEASEGLPEGVNYQGQIGLDDNGEVVGVGRFRYEDVNGDGRITPDDRTFLGSPNPDFTYGLNLGFNFKNWDMNLFVYGSQGAEIWNQVKWWTDFYGPFRGAKSHTALYDSWTPDNPDASVPIQESDNSFSTNQVPNSYFVEDGSYLRLKNVQVGYTLPARLMNPLGVEQLRVYAQAANLFTITGYSGIDPEISGNVTSFGIDEGTYSTPRQFLFGVNLTF